MWSVATRHCVATDCASVHHRCRALSATGSAAPQQVALRCNGHYNRLHRCNALQRVERRPVLQQNRPLLQHAVRRCNRLRSRAAVLRCRTEHCCNTRCAVATNGQQCRLRRRTHYAERRCNTRCAVATNGQQCRLRRRTNLRSVVALRDAPYAVATEWQLVWERRRTNLLSAVPSRYTPLQQMGDHVGCVVARSCRALLQHAMRRCNGWATELVASSRKPECCCKQAMLLCDPHRPLGGLSCDGCTTAD